MSRSGSELTDSTAMTSLATSDSASTPQIRSLMRLSCSRNMRSPRLPQARQVALQEIVPAHRRRRLRIVQTGEQLAGVELALAGGSAGGGAARQAGQTLTNRRRS